MALAFASLTTVQTAVTAAAAGDAKGIALANGMAEAVVNEICRSGAFTPQMRAVLDAVKADFVANAGLFTTALAA
jgi:hypothetical protein